MGTALGVFVLAILKGEFGIPVACGAMWPGVKLPCHLMTALIARGVAESGSLEADKWEQVP
jgi:hypothetical protein